MIYPNSGNGYKNEQALADILATYRKKDGETVLSSYTAYTNTVRELYDTQKPYRNWNFPKRTRSSCLPSTAFTARPTMCV